MSIVMSAYVVHKHCSYAVISDIHHHSSIFRAEQLVFNALYSPFKLFIQGGKGTAKRIISLMQKWHRRKMAMSEHIYTQTYFK